MIKYDKKTSKICHKNKSYEGDQHAWLCQSPLQYVTHFWPKKRQKSKGFFVFLRGINNECWPEMA